MLAGCPPADEGVDGQIGGVCYYWTWAPSYICDTNTYTPRVMSKFFVSDATLAPHSLLATSIWSNYPLSCDTGVHGPNSGTFTSSDGYTLVVTPNITDNFVNYPPFLTLYDPSGNIVTNTSVQDPDGAVMELTDDTLGTSAMPYYDAQNNTQNYSVAYSNYTVQTAFGCPSNTPADWGPSTDV
jgi:hypothetical protein